MSKLAPDARRSIIFLASPPSPSSSPSPASPSASTSSSVDFFNRSKNVARTVVARAFRPVAIRSWFERVTECVVERARGVVRAAALDGASMARDDLRWRARRGGVPRSIFFIISHNLTYPNVRIYIFMTDSCAKTAH